MRKAISVRCPTCGALPGHKCVAVLVPSLKGFPMNHVHEARIKEVDVQWQQ